MFVIAREDPRQPDVARLVYELDEMFQRLYPAESNHLVDIETLAEPDIHFFVARRDGEALGTGRCGIAIRLMGKRSASISVWRRGG